MTSVVTIQVSKVLKLSSRCKNSDTLPFANMQEASLYRHTTVGLALQEALSEMHSTGQISLESAHGTLDLFDQVRLRFEHVAFQYNIDAGLG